MVLGKLSVPRRLTKLDNSRARTYYACRVGVVLTFFLSSFLFSFPFSRRRPDID